MKKIFFTVITGLFFLSNCFSQSIGMGTPTPNSSAQLDITSTTQGVLIPRMTTAGVIGISNPAKGLLVYDTVKNQLMVNMGTGSLPNWQTIVFNSGWSLGGNSGTDPSTQFIGTIDNQPLNFRVNNQPAGTIDNSTGNVTFGGFIGVPSGGANSFFGSSSGAFTSTGSSNSFFGFQSGKTNSTGVANSFFGNGAGAAAAASFNSFFGSSAGTSNTTGDGNCFFGDGAGGSTTTGSNNSFFGSVAGNTNHGGSQNSFFGEHADASTIGLTNATAIGANSQVAANNSLVLGSINGINGAVADTKVGIGTTTPAAKLHISQGSFGGTYLFDDFIVEDNNSTYVNVLSPTANENGILFGLTDDAASGGIVYNNSSTKKGLQFRTFNNTTKMVIDSVGNIGIGTQTPSYTFHVVNNNPADGGFANGIVVENINATTGEAAISFKNTGTTGTGSKLWIVGLNQDRNLDFNYGTTLAGSNTKMVIDSTGNVGIGNLVPAEKLDITGNIKVNGNVTRPSTGTANMVPICYGNITSAGLIVSGTSNFTITHPATGTYNITISGESYSINTYSSFVTPISSSAIIPSTFSSGSSLQVRIFNTSGSLTDQDFNFIVYKN